MSNILSHAEREALKQEIFHSLHCTLPGNIVTFNPETQTCSVTLRPFDATGDILPVLSSRDLLSGPEAVARLVADKLSLLQGDWWENPDEGFFILEFMIEECFSEANASMFASRVMEFICGVDGVFEVDEVSFEAEGRVFRYSCRLLTEEGPAAMEYTFL